MSAEPTPTESREQRRQRRRATITGHKTSSFAEADRWDLAFWQSQTPQDRLSALVAIRRDVELVQRAKAAEILPGDQADD